MSSRKAVPELDVKGPPDGRYVNVQYVANYLNIKVSTLYAWAAEGKIPSMRIHGLIRFRLGDIETWLRSFQGMEPKGASRADIGLGAKHGGAEVDSIIARAMSASYNPNGETKRAPGAIRKEDGDGPVSQK